MCLQASTDREGYWFPLPEGWIERPLGELFETQLGKMKGKNASLGEQFYYLKGRNLQWGDVQIDSLETMHFSPSERVQYELSAGDLLVCEYGEVGRCAIWEDSVPNCYFQNHIYRIRAKGDVPVEYLRYFLEYATKMPDFSRFVTQTSVQQISQGNLRSIPIPYPNDFAKINTSFSNMMQIDASINGLYKELSKYQSLSDGLSCDFVDEIIQLGQFTLISGLCQFVTKGATPTTYGGNFTSRGVPFVRTQNFTDYGNIDLEGILRISEETHRTQSRSCIIENDVLMTIVGSVGRVCKWNYSHQANCSQNLAILRCLEDENSDYLFEIMSTNWYYDSLHRDIIQTAQPSINLGEILSHPIPFPEDSEKRDTFVRNQQNIRDLLTNQRHLINKYEMIREGILFDIFGGLSDRIH